ncbi:hypothetical protein GCM10017691_23080 [Pseudonocardia petroleophila]
MLMDPGTAAEPASRITHELEGSPKLAAVVTGTVDCPGGGGHAWVLSDLESLLETGAPLAG